MGIGFGAFVRVDFPLQIINNQLFNLGEHYAVVNIIDKMGADYENTSKLDYENLTEKEKNNLQLRLKIFGLISNEDV